MQIKSILVFPLVFLFLQVFVQCSPEQEIEKSSFDIYKKYSKIDGAEVFSLPPQLVSVFLDDETTGNPEIKDLLQDVKFLTLLMIPNKGKTKESIQFASISHELKELNYVDLTMVNNGNEIVKVKILRDSSSIEELVVLISNYETLFCVSFIGEIQMNKIVNLTKPENMIAISNLNRLSNK
ncbi:MAG TPA: DUF4252 domain-containing protein [Tenuifilaceae bacterium]|nr:DUF4252 domain-containing protein [Tenuifilaceae bacterium]HPE18295.1 DUF4252 domain-containing protein [Tenuifilaceae bacterium]HPJ46871.1 DUF4252 domain-containing protein [Tenuifilaceae bacterium]HPQ34618.1 DUF4252 domain-containing protein [Tenuifilaceae bacterium]HRX68946.1 DUF4252 domain-containing protein [Tenuifilaceae bacterium]